MKKMLSEQEAAVMKRLLERGFKQHEVAALVGHNGGRANEVAKGQRFEDVPPADDAVVEKMVMKVLNDYASRVGL